jgi:hypothetical protein
MGAPRFSYRYGNLYSKQSNKKSKKGEEDDDSRVSRRHQGPRLEAGSRAHLVVV